MTGRQYNFIGSIPFMRHVSPHRQCWFMPAWIRDGYETEAHMYHDRAATLEKMHAISNPDHPNHDLAIAAEKLKL